MEEVHNKDDHIMDSPDVMTVKELAGLMNTRWAGKNIVYYDATDSTNLRIKQLGREGAPHGTLAVAEQQAAGRGRRGRSWESPAGCGIYMSILLRPDIEPDKAPMLTLVAACSVAESLQDLCTGNMQVQIKWPNDIIISGKKLAGILTEMNVRAGKVDYVVVGMGINVNIADFPEKIRKTATSLRIESGRRIERAPVIAAVMERLEADYRIFMRTQDLSGLMDAYSRMLVNKDRDVLILGEKEQYRAHALGITPMGELIVRRGNGAEEKIRAGEVSVRGVYGYV